MSGYLIGPCGVAPAVVVGGGGIALNTSVHGNFSSNTSFALTGITAPVNGINIVEISWNPVGNTIDLAALHPVSDPIGDYTEIGRVSASGIALFYAVRTSAQSSNVITIATAAATTLSANVGVFTGLNTSAPVDTGGTFTGAVAGPTPAPAWTTSVANTVLVTSVGPNSGTMGVSGGSWVALNTASDFGALVYEIVSSSGVQTPPTYTDTIYASVTTAFKA